MTRPDRWTQIAAIVAPEFTPADFAQVAAILRVFANEDSDKLHAAMVLYQYIILAALDVAAGGV